MGLFLRLSSGQARQFAEGGATTIYDQQLSVISGTPSGSNQVQGPVNTGVPVTLPASQTYTSAELQVTLNGQALEAVGDYSYVGSIPRTQIAFTFQLVVGDIIDFRIIRGP